MTWGPLAVCMVLGATAMGCAADRADRADRDRADRPGPDRSVQPTAGEQDVVVTEDDRSLPEGCRPAAIAGLLGELFEALNRGDREAAAALVVDREMLALLERPAASRPLRLRAVIVGMANGLGQIEFRAAGRLVGKGAVDCGTRRLVAVGLGRERVRMAPLCGGRPGDRALACVRHWS